MEYLRYSVGYDKKTIIHLYIIFNYGLCAQMVKCESNSHCPNNQVNWQKKQNYSRLRSNAKSQDSQKRIQKGKSNLFDKSKFILCGCFRYLQVLHFPFCAVSRFQSFKTIFQNLQSHLLYFLTFLASIIRNQYLINIFSLKE